MGTRWYGADAELVRPIENSFRGAPAHSELPHFFTVYNFYVRDKTGKIVINPVYFTSAQTGMRLDNQHLQNHDGLTPTAGCPGAKRSFKARAGDLLPEQLAAMKNDLGFGVVETEKRVVIRPPRSAIEQLHILHVQHLGNILLHTAEETAGSR
jgi:hypothetical protein